MFLGLRTAIYPTDDIEAAKAWWSKVLGFEPYFDEPFYVGYEVGGYELGLVPKGDTESTDGVHTYWGVPDAKAAVEALVGAGATLESEPTDVGDGILVATVREPGGNLLGVIENPHFAVKPVEAPGPGPGR